MRVPLSWLKDFVDITEDIQTLCKKMVDIGLEIEEVDYLGKNVSNIVVCQIEEIAQHPNAERLLCCKVNIGNEIIPIVTNDHHVQVGDKVPVALHNAQTANGLHITKGKMRGEPSFGMFCGAEEVGITKDYYEGADYDGVLVLRKDAEIGQDIRKEVGTDDYVLDVCVTSNRQDCNSVLGIAREVAVALGKTCKEPDVSYTEESAQTTGLVTVNVQDGDICPTYYMQGLTDVVVAPSPLWLTSRLAKVGLHGINNLVDITNYVLYEIGQPMHAFDYKEINNKTIIVRRANNGEEIVPLDGKTYSLSTDDIVIADSSRAVGLGGIMGGANSGIVDDTNCVLFESATFARGNIRRTSRRLGLRSDSSARFEKGIDAYTNNLGLSRALHLAQKLGCGKVTTGRICVGVEGQERTVEFETPRIKQLLGIEIPNQRILQILSSLNIQTAIDGTHITCIVPAYREDIARDCDIIEELIRVYGYDNITGTLMEGSHITCGGKTPIDAHLDSVRDVLNGLRYDECIFYPFAGKALFDKASLLPVDESKYIRVMNPIGEELSLMNVSLAPNMLQCIALNLSRQNSKLKLFEIGKAYLADSLPLTKLPVEQKRISICATEVDFDTFRTNVLQVVSTFVGPKGIKLVRTTDSALLHPGVAADIYFDDVLCGYMGKLHPQIAANFDINVDTYIAELYVDELWKNKKEQTKFVAFGKFPAITRDFAFLCNEEVLAQNILDEFLNLPLVESATLFDTYRSEQLGAGKKSLAISVVFRDANKTLQDNDIEKQAGKALRAINEKYGAALR